MQEDDGMGTKVQYVSNVLVTSLENENRMDDWKFFKNKGMKVELKSTCIDKLQISMDQILEQHNMEAIKKTMMMHEDLFKHQVQELHRLYNVQKKMMGEMKGEKKRICSPIDATSGFNQAACSSNSSGERLRITKDYEQGEVELTLTIGTVSMLKKKHRSLELGGSDLTNNETAELGSSSSFKSDRGDECCDPSNAASSSSATTEHEKKQPHWLFQELSLNRTQL